MAANQHNTYTVVARRYRPQTFADLVGQTHVVTALTNALLQQRVGHAYLFAGTRGAGKTSTARIFGKCLNCVQGPTTRPCNECDICQSISIGEDVDVLEIDGASNRGIEEIRQLRSNVNILPSRSRFKIYIIDEVHMLSKDAFNALLKTLEEPPEHVKFIFCTTDPQKIPVTVLSRCQRFDFVPVETGDILRRLREISESENVSADEAALQLIARRATGSLRDSQSLLEQLLAYCESKITIADVHALLGTADNELLFGLAAAMLSCDASTALRSVADAIAKGCDPGQLSEQLVGFYRDMMVAKVGGDSQLMLYIDDEEFARLNALAAGIGLEKLLAILQIIDQAVERIQKSMHSRVLLEAAILRVCELENLQSIVELMSAVQSSGTPWTSQTQSAPPASNATTARASTQSQNVPIAAQKLASNKEKLDDVSATAAGGTTPKKKEHDRLIAESTLAVTAGAGEPGGGLTDPVALWNVTLSKLGDFSADAAADFRAVQLVNGDTLQVTLPSEYQLQICTRPDRVQKIEEALASVAGRRLRLQFDCPAGENNVEAMASSPKLNRHQQIRQLSAHPLVKAVIATFDAEITDFELARPTSPKPIRESDRTDRELTDLEV